MKIFSETDVEAIHIVRRTIIYLLEKSGLDYTFVGVFCLTDGVTIKVRLSQQCADSLAVERIEGKQSSYNIAGENLIRASCIVAFDEVLQALKSIE